MTISIIICTYNRAESLRRTLATLIPANVRDVLEVIVIDNNSSDHTRDVLREYEGLCPDIFRSAVETRRGKAAALNRALSMARGDAFAFTDDDVLLPENWINEARRALDGHPECDVFGGRVVPVPPEGMEFPSWVHWEDPYNIAEGPLVDHNKGGEVKSYHEPGMCTPIGANFFARRRAFERIGPFGEVNAATGGPATNEDSVWCNMAKNRGEAMLYVPDVAVRHVTPPGRMTKEYFSLYYRNSAKTCVANTPVDQDDPYRIFNVPRWFYVKLLRALGTYLGSALSLERESLVYAKKMQLVYFLSVVREFIRGYSRRSGAQSSSK